MQRGSSVNWANFSASSRMRLARTASHVGGAGGGAGSRGGLFGIAERRRLPKNGCALALSGGPRSAMDRGMSPRRRIPMFEAKMAVSKQTCSCFPRKQMETRRNGPERDGWDWGGSRCTRTDTKNQRGQDTENSGRREEEWDYFKSGQ